jgi:hypothetical protein
VVALGPLVLLFSIRGFLILLRQVQALGRD